MRICGWKEKRTGREMEEMEKEAKTESGASVSGETAASGNGTRVYDPDVEGEGGMANGTTSVRANGRTPGALGHSSALPTADGRTSRAPAPICLHPRDACCDRQHGEGVHTVCDYPRHGTSARPPAHEHRRPTCLLRPR